MTTDRFSTLTGFPERSWARTQASLSVAGAELRSLANSRTFAIGTLETPSVADLRARALADLRGSSEEPPYIGGGAPP